MHYRYCPMCRGELDLRNISLAVCRECGYHFYQNSKPTANAVILKNSGRNMEVLLCRRGVEPFKGHWDLPGGFLHNGENPAAGLKREIDEELGINLIDPLLFFTYAEIYPVKDIPDEASYTLSLYYLCRIKTEIQFRAADDIVEAAWFNLNSLPDTLAFRGNRAVLKKVLTEAE